MDPEGRRPPAVPRWKGGEGFDRRPLCLRSPSMMLLVALCSANSLTCALFFRAKGMIDVDVAAEAFHRAVCCPYRAPDVGCYEQRCIHTF